MAPGMPSHASSATFRCACALRVRRRSSGSRGRMEIRFSCCASQLTVLRNRSRLPCTPSQPFEAKSESPMAATRVSGFGASAAGVLVSLAGLAPGPAAAASARQPTRRPPATPAPGRPCPCRTRSASVRTGPRVGLAPALRRALDECLRRPAVRAALHGPDRPGQRVGGDHAKPLHDRVRRVAHRDRCHLVRAEQLAHAARVHDHVGACLDAPVLQQRHEVGQRGLTLLVRRIEHHEQLAPAIEVLLDGVHFSLQEIRARPGDDQHGGVGRHLGLLREGEGVGLVVLGAERLVDRAEALTLAAGGVVFAMPLQEIHGALGAAQQLDQGVCELLLVGAHHGLRAVLVGEDRRAERLHLVLVGPDRVLYGIDRTLP